MASAGKVFAYCERGLDPSFWAEPLNALTNLTFIAAAVTSIHLLRRRPPHEPLLFRLYLSAVAFAIGLGSFAFHTLATPWSARLDVIPIGVFMLSYLGYALYRMVRVPLWLTLPLVGAFAAIIGAAMRLRCWDGQIGFAVAAPAWQNAACLNGSVGYLPALGAMLVIGGLLALRRHPAAGYLLAAAAVFTVSVTFRTLDWTLCRTVVVAGSRIGTHFLWHVLNGITLFLLLLAAIRHGAAHIPEIRPPQPRQG